MVPEQPTPQMHRKSTLDRLHDRCRLALPSRIAAIALFAIAGLILSGVDLGVQLGWFLTYAAAVLASLCGSNAFVFFALLGVAFATIVIRSLGRWLGLRNALWFDLVKGFLSVVNRQGSHLEAELVWIIVLFISTDDLAPQLGLLAAILFLSEPLLDHAGYVLKSRMEETSGDAPPVGWRTALARTWHWFQRPFARGLESGRLVADEERPLIHWARRPFIGVAAIGGCHVLLLVPQTCEHAGLIAVGVAFAVSGALLALLSVAPTAPRWAVRAAFAGAVACSICVFAVAPAQRWAIAAFVAAVGLNAFFRLGKWLAYDNRAPEGDAGRPWNVLDHYREQRNARELTRVRWVDGPLMIAAPVVAFAIVFAAVSRVSTAQEDRADEVESACAPGAAGPGLGDQRIRVFLLADSQLHNLAGARFPGQMEVATALVPVARRPVELDVLSEGTLLHFAALYGDLRARAFPKLSWAYLGDFTDLACADEMRRMIRTLDAFGRESLVGVAPGNHDNAFTGNFDWSPYWEVACRPGGPDDAAVDGHLGKALSDRMLLSAYRSPLSRDGALVPVALSEGGPTQALAGLHRLGALEVGSQKREIWGVFLDTSDKIDSDYGVAGSIGTLSRAQADAVIGALDAAGLARPSFDGAFVVFTHHPVDELGASAARQLERIVARLNGAGHRVVGFVSGHTHRAQLRHGLCLGNRSYDDAIIGSTTDAPQEAALLEIGLNAVGEIAAEVVTLPAVARPGKAYAIGAPQDGIPSAERCAGAVERLAADRCCASLSARQDGRPTTTCARFRDSDSLSQKILAVEGLRAPGELKKADAIRASELLRCLARDPSRPGAGRCPPIDAAAALRDETIFPILSRAVGTAEGREEVACLGWAASAAQAYKAADMEFADALRCSFGGEGACPPEDGEIQAAKRMPLVLRLRSCL
jgi:hypothetical protein